MTRFDWIFQRNCIEFALKAKPFRRYIPKQRLQYKVWWLGTSQPFEYVIFTLILINTITLGMKFYGQPLVYTQALDILNMIFTTVFAIEFVLKLAAFRFKVGCYSCSWWLHSMLMYFYSPGSYAELLQWSLECVRFHHRSGQLHRHRLFGRECNNAAGITQSISIVLIASIYLL